MDLKLVLIDAELGYVTPQSRGQLLECRHLL